MVLQVSGPISMDDIYTEYQSEGSVNYSLSSYIGIGWYNPVTEESGFFSSPMSMSEFYGTQYDGG